MKKKKKERCFICYSPSQLKIQKTIKISIKIINTLGFKKLSNFIDFFYYKSPILKKIEPQFGKINGGTLIKVYGKGFLNFGKYVQCIFNLNFISSIFINDSEIHCRFFFFWIFINNLIKFK